MAYLAFTILVLGLSMFFLPRILGVEMLPQWLRPAKRRDMGEAQGLVPGVEPDSSLEKHNASIEGNASPKSETTPKASTSNGQLAVPAFSLSEHLDTEVSPEQSEESVPSFPATNSAQRTQSNGPGEYTTSAPQKSASTLMPPPALPKPKPAVNAASALRVPTSGPLPNRGPPASSQQRAKGGLSANGAVATPNSRGKVLLAPGHSPMDWAALTRKGNLSGVGTFQRVTPSMLKSMTGRKGKPAWSSWYGKVYNITPYLPFHPGGEAELMKAAGRDGKKLFEEVHPWVNWENMLGTCLVGVLVPEDYERETEDGSRLDDLD